MIENGVKYFGSYNHGLWIYNDTIWSVINKSNSGIGSNSVNSVIRTSDSSLWLSGDYGISRFYNNQWTVWDTSNSPLNGGAMHLLEDKMKNIYMISGRAVFKLDLTTDINNNIGEESLFLFPNPVIEGVFFNSSKNLIEAIVILDLSGKMVLNKNKINLSKTEINLSILTPGIYFAKIKFQNLNQILVKKIVKI